MVSKSRVSHLPQRARNVPASGGQDSFHFSQTALAPNAPIIALQTAPTELAAARPGGLLFRTASALFPHAGRLADADAAANSNAPASRQLRGVSGDDIAWMTVAAAIGLTAQTARANASDQDAHKDLNGPTDELDQAALQAASAQNAAHAAPGFVAEKAEQKVAAQSPDSSDAVIVAANGDDLLGGGGSDPLSDDAVPYQSNDSSHVGSSHFVIGQDGAVELGSDEDGVGQDSGMQQSGAYQAIIGSDGDDVFQGGMGHQAIYGGSGFDTVVYGGSVEDAQISIMQGRAAGTAEAAAHSHAAAEPQQDAASGPVVTVSTGPDKSDTLVSIEQLKFSEGSYAIVTAAEGSHAAQGAAAADIVIGSGEGDVLTGGGGNDVLVAGSSDDTAAFSGSANDYKVSLSAHGNVVVADQTEDRDGKDILIGVESASFDGETYGLTAGTSGDDILVAGDGPQLMIGGAGHDIFVFNSSIMAVHRANALDMVADFSQGMDRIDLRWIDFDPFLVGSDAFIWDGSDTDNSGNHSQGHVGYHVEQTDNDWQTIIDGHSGNSGSGGGSDFHIALRGHIELKQADFIL